jgi:outer membrane scaffolding protein for murein synthesis (MipA/OmpV family)
MTSHLSCTTWQVQVRFLLILCIIWWGFHPLLIRAAAAESNDTPLWEIGLTAAGGWVPDYPAADEYHLAKLALPYAIYRGSIFRAGEEGIARGRFLRHRHVELDIGLAASLPADSDQNSARRGMPDLDTLIEVGPRLGIRLAGLKTTSNLSLQLAVRPVMSVDWSHLAYRGIVFNPQLVYTHRRLFNSKTRFVARLGPVFATSEFMDYFYEVDPHFATPSRPEFNAQGGYLGSRLSLSLLTSLTNRIRIFGAMRIGYYEGATNEDSPLFRDQLNVGVGLGVIWSVFQSKRQAAD